MPLIRNMMPEHQVNLGLWEITEPAEYFLERLKLNEHDHEVLDTIKAPDRLLEFLASRYLLRVLIGAEHSLVLTKDEYGKPGILDPDCQVSISHCKGYAAAIVSYADKPVGIDVERREKRVMRIRERFLSEREKRLVPANNVAKTILFWSAKETMYKIYGKKQLSFSQNLLLDEPGEGLSGALKGTFAINGTRDDIDVSFVINENYILTFAVGSGVASIK